jgi:hypothetical protein
LIGAGTIINPILKIVTTVAILGAAYIFIVKPVLDTTEEISGNVSEQVQAGLGNNDDFNLNFAKDRAESFASSLRTQWPEAAREVTNCVRQANKDAKAMDKCDDLGQELVTEGQSPRNFSLSYADSLSAQGKTAEAAQVEKCVEDAAFNVRDLQRCRDLADRLLFP